MTRETHYLGHYFCATNGYDKEFIALKLAGTVFISSYVYSLWHHHIEIFTVARDRYLGVWFEICVRK